MVHNPVLIFLQEVHSFACSERHEVKRLDDVVPNPSYAKKMCLRMHPFSLQPEITSFSQAEESHLAFLVIRDIAHTGCRRRTLCVRNAWGTLIHRFGVQKLSRSAALSTHVTNGISRIIFALHGGHTRW